MKAWVAKMGDFIREIWPIAVLAIALGLYILWMGY